MNAHIKKYLDYYYKLKISPEYAILLRGNWGAGKTWFIKNYLKENATIEYLYVSLNGISTFQEIEDSFFQQLHPVLASKSMKIAGKILKGLIKTTIKIDIDDDNKSDASISSTLPDFNLPDYFTNLDSKILIFDDLERCAISTPKVLGYINHFVEINGLKVIILGNEEELIKRDNIVLNNETLDKESIKYLEIKEKVIGKSFEIKSDLDSALKYFINQLSNRQQKKILLEKIQLIIDIYHTAGYGNLRHLRQSILDFGKFYNYLPEIVNSKEELINHVIQLFFTISIELRKGVLSEDDIHKLFNFDSIARNESKSLNSSQEIRKKYSVFRNYYHPFDNSFLKQFFKYGILDKVSIKTSIKNSIYFKEENTPNWIKLWSYFDLEDDKFEQISKSVVEQFFNSKIDNKYELLQVSGLLFNFAELKLVEYNKEEILEQAKKNIDNLKLKGLFKKTKHEKYPHLSSNGLNIQGQNFKEFKELYEYAKQEVNNSLTEEYLEKAKVLLALLNESVFEFGELITFKNSNKNLYYDIPILKFIPVKDFVRTFISLKNKDKLELSRILDDRYRRIQQFESLYEELDWLVEIYNNIEKEIVIHKGRISGLLLKDILLALKEIIEKIEVYYLLDKKD